MEIITATDSDFTQHLAAKPVAAVKFFADWCGSCKLFSPKFKRIAQQENFSEVTFLEVNAETSPEARKLAGVNNLPFVAVFKDGQLVEGHATSKEEAVSQMISQAQSTSN